MFVASDEATLYQQIPSRRLVVLGRAGSGKTVLALRLVLDLLDTRTPDTRIPVIFSVGSWNPTTVSLEDWLVSQLIRDHPWLAEAGDGTGTLGAELVRARWVLPVLDGFDEIAKDLHPVARQRLSEADMPMVLTSRREEYVAAVNGTRGVHRAAVIELTDLALDDVKGYLRLANPKATRWDPVLDQLCPESDNPAAADLAAVLTSPLMVDLARIVYRDETDRDPETLLNIRFSTVDALEGHLLGEFLSSVYGPDSQRPARSRRWTPERAQRWLRYLARHLQVLRAPKSDSSDNNSDLAWWELGITMSRLSRTLVISVLAGLTFGTVTGIGNIRVDLVATPFGLTFALQRGLVVGVLHGLAGGLVFGLMYWFADGRHARKPSPVRIRLTGGASQLGAKLATRLKPGIPLGVVYALAVVLLDRTVVAGLGLDDGLGGGLGSAVTFVFGIGLGTGLVLALMAWLEAPIDVDSAVSPTYLLTVNRTNVIVQMLVWALVLGTPAGLASSFTYDPVRSLEIGLVFGLEGAFMGGLGYGLSLTAWGQWVALARIWLPLTRRLPWRLITFLDDACERGVLRKTGAAYQFRHARLQEHLTGTRQTSCTASP